MNDEATAPVYEVEVHRDVGIPMRDGTIVAADVYRPKAEGRFPSLYAVSPYGKDFAYLPAGPTFRFRETGRIEWFVQRGYGYVLMDVRGTGKSRQGEWRMWDRTEQQDMYDAIEWIAAQPWCTGKVGMIGESYFGVVQWLAAAMRPPHLACIAPYDAFVDLYRDVAYHGGIPCGGFTAWWAFDTRARTLLEIPGPHGDNVMRYDLILEQIRHPTDGPFWEERSAFPKLDQIEVPAYSIGNWKMVGLHLRGNLLAYELLRGPKKLLVNGGAKGGVGTDDSIRIFDSIDMHQELLRWYDHWLKGIDTGIMSEPPVRIFVQDPDHEDGGEHRFEAEWPLSRAEPRRLYLAPGPTGDERSLNDGRLSWEVPEADGATAIHYPDPEWSGWPGLGTGVFAETGLPNAIKRIVTFTSETLDEDLEVTGPIELTLWAATDQRDTEFLVRLSDELSVSVIKGFMVKNIARLAPPAKVLTKGWLRASHRALDPNRTQVGRPWHAHRAPELLEPGRVYEYKIELWPTSWVFRKGHRIRLELAPGDSPVFDAPFSHHYGTKMGTDHYHHGPTHPSSLLLPVVPKKQS